MTCAGGTGGGIYPALAVLKAIGGKAEILWIGGEGGMEDDLIRRAGIPFESIPAAGVHGVSLHQLPGNTWRLVRGFFAARRILRRFKPDVLFFTGGYLAVPVALAGRRYPSLLYVPDVEPGLAHRTIAPFADVIAVTHEASRRYFQHRNVMVTGYPTRSSMVEWTPAEARKKFGLEGRSPVLLVIGGSRGARSINTSVLDHLPDMLKLAHVIHVSGEFDWPVIEEASRNLPADLSKRYHAFAYLHEEEIGAAMASADLIVSRAGASTLGEYPLFAVPSILVPYPYAWRTQMVNADFLAGVGAAVILEDAHLRKDLLIVVKELLANEAKRRSMSKAARGLFQPQAAVRIAGQLVALAGKS